MVCLLNSRKCLELYSFIIIILLFLFVCVVCTITITLSLDVLRAEGERVMATLLQRLLERDDDDELKGLHCTTIRRVTSVTDDSKLLKERAHKLKPILNELKDKVDEEDVRN